ncbi:ATP-binding cassette domain-containing protein, partial [Kibdelosporangium lantanae]
MTEQTTTTESPQRTEVLIEATGLQKYFPIRKGLLQRTKGHVQAVDGLDFAVHKGETLSLVGESGCGKSTTGRAVLQLHKPTSGSVRFQGKELTTLSNKGMRTVRRDMQIVFQDPYASLNPRWQINDIVSEPFNIHGFDGNAAAKQQRVDELLELVGLNPEHRNRYGHEFSGGFPTRSPGRMPCSVISLRSTGMAVSANSGSPILLPDALR